MIFVNYSFIFHLATIEVEILSLMMVLVQQYTVECQFFVDRVKFKNPKKPHILRTMVHSSLLRQDNGCIELKIKYNTI